MRKRVRAGIVAGMTAASLLVGAPASASAPQFEFCTVWYNGLLGGGSCHTHTIAAHSGGQWVRGGVDGGYGATFRIRDMDTGATVCGEHTAWQYSSAITCFGLVGKRYRVDVVGAPVAALGWIRNY
jgi:hypothetical protein